MIEWIDVKERLPDMGAVVLVYTDAQTAVVARRVASPSPAYGDWVWDHDEGYGLEGATHWASLAGPFDTEIRL